MLIGRGGHTSRGRGRGRGVPNTMISSDEDTDLMAMRHRFSGVSLHPTTDDHGDIDTSMDNSSLPLVSHSSDRVRIATPEQLKQLFQHQQQRRRPRRLHQIDCFDIDVEEERKRQHEVEVAAIRTLIGKFGLPPVPPGIWTAPVARPKLTLCPSSSNSSNISNKSSGCRSRIFTTEDESLLTPTTNDGPREYDRKSTITDAFNKIVDHQYNDIMTSVEMEKYNELVLLPALRRYQEYKDDHEKDDDDSDPICRTPLPNMSISPKSSIGLHQVVNRSSPPLEDIDPTLKPLAAFFADWNNASLWRRNDNNYCVLEFVAYQIFVVSAILQTIKKNLLAGASGFTINDMPKVLLQINNNRTTLSNLCTRYNDLKQQV